MHSYRRHVHRAALSVAILSASLTACSSSPDMRDCGYSVTWQGRVYWGLGYALHKPQTQADVDIPVQGRRLGRGFVPRCPGDRNGSPATVYAVPNVSPRLAVMARTDTQRREPAILVIRQGRALPKALLRQP